MPCNSNNKDENCQWENAKTVENWLLEAIIVLLLLLLFIYLLQLGLHPVAVVLTLHNYNKKHTLTTTKNKQIREGNSMDMF
jgi:hypothetical protein